MSRNDETVSREDWFQRPSLLARNLDISLLGGHFLLAQDSGGMPASWQLLSRDGWHLAHDVALPVADVVDRNTVPVGWVIGHPLDLDARKMARTHALPFGVASSKFEDRVDHWFARYGGRYAVIITRPRPIMIPDAFGSLPVLFDPPTKRASSSPLLLRQPDGSVPDSLLVDTLNTFSSSRVFPFGLTPHATACLLLPLFILELDSFETHRVWPTEPLERIDPNKAIPRIAELIEATIAAAAAESRASLALTAGGDSRMLLACSRELLDRLRLFTIPHSDITGRTDVRIARQITGSLGLDHLLLNWIEPTDEDERRWMIRTGALYGERRGRRAGPTLAQLGGDGAYISGVGFEVARGLKWQPSDATNAGISAIELLARLGYPSTPELLGACERWLAELPKLDTRDVIDLAYHDTPPGPLTLGYPDAMTTTIYPFGNREILDLCLRLPYEDRASDRLRSEIIQERWPELSRFPVNKPLLRHRVPHYANRVSQLPAGAVRRARRRMDAQAKG